MNRNSRRTNADGTVCGLKVRRLHIDTHHQPVIYMRSDCPICRSEGFQSHTRVQVNLGGNSIIAALDIVHGDLLAVDEVGLSEIAWKKLQAEEGAIATFAHADPLESMSHVRAKIYGRRLGETELEAVIGDIVAGRYADVHLAAFIAACGGDRLSLPEIAALTRAMVNTGERLSWGNGMIVDKHCIGGIPGNRTTPIVVPIIAALGLVMPKTSSRAITSPAGTADTMEMLAPVDLAPPAMRRVVERTGGCIVWGGAVQLSPVDDMLIRIERQLDIDSEGQLVASVLSKKAAAGSTHVLVDLPVGTTAKVRSAKSAAVLSKLFAVVGEAIGLSVRCVTTDGSQPVGRGIGPALEARDVLSVLRVEPGAPADLRERALMLAGLILEQAGKSPQGEGHARAGSVLEDGEAWKKFQAICEAQGGMREPPVARQRVDVASDRSGRILSIDNRRLALTAKLAGAPEDKAAGIDLHVRAGMPVDSGQPLFTLHAESTGTLEYALDFFRGHPDIIRVGDEA